jgi:CheY-like chemotaxis protein
MNLVANAVKFTEEGMVTVRVLAHAPGIAETVEVIDTGIGIDADRLGAIFEVFEQADASTGRRFGGTGLGLPISRSLCKLLGCQLSVESAPGNGSTFRILLPHRTAENASEGRAITPTREQNIAGSTALLDRNLVLVVDDDEAARSLVASEIRSLGGVVLEASSGAEALRLAEQRRPFLIVLDLLMPGMDGWEFMSRIAENDELRGTPIVVVSAAATESREALVGRVDALLKPFSPEDFARVLKRTAGIGRTLIVEDDSDTQVLLSNYIFEAGAAEVRVAHSGEEALRIFDQYRPDLIVLDLVFPGMSGATFLDEIARREPDARFSVLIVTSKEVAPDELRGFRLTTLGLLHKGGNLERDLKEAIQDFVRQKRSVAREPVATV